MNPTMTILVQKQMKVDHHLQYPLCRMTCPRLIQKMPLSHSQTLRQMALQKNYNQALMPQSQNPRETGEQLETLTQV